MLALKWATEEDYASVYNLCSDLYDYSYYAGKYSFNEDRFADAFKVMISSLEDNCVILLKDNEEMVGFIAGSVYSPLFSLDKSAIEIAFWITPEWRSITTTKLLISAFKEWARRAGCSTVMLAKISKPQTPEKHYIRYLTKGQKGEF